MFKLVLISFAGCFFLLSSCTQDSQQITNPVEQPVQEAPPSSSPAPAPPDTSIKSNQPVQVSNPNPQSKTITTSNMPKVSADDINPSHGQPGHRCDIPVGALLSSPRGTHIEPAIVNPPDVPTSKSPVKLEPVEAPGTKKAAEMQGSRPN